MLISLCPFWMFACITVSIWYLVSGSILWRILILAGKCSILLYPQTSYLVLWIILRNWKLSLVWLLSVIDLSQTSLNHILHYMLPSVLATLCCLFLPLWSPWPEGFLWVCASGHLCLCPANHHLLNIIEYIYALRDWQVIPLLLIPQNNHANQPVLHGNQPSHCFLAVLWPIVVMVH